MSILVLLCVLNHTPKMLTGLSTADLACLVDSSAQCYLYIKVCQKALLFSAIVKPLNKGHIGTGQLSLVERLSSSQRFSFKPLGNRSGVCFLECISLIRYNQRGGGGEPSVQRSAFRAGPGNEARYRYGHSKAVAGLLTD